MDHNTVSHGFTVTKLLDTEPASCYSQAKKVPFARDFFDNFLVIYGNDILAFFGSITANISGVKLDEVLFVLNC